MSDATIYDLGYRRYDGPRTGVPGALRTLIRHSIRSALGLGRSARHKVLPFAIVIFSYIPAVVFTGLAALFGDTFGEELPTYAEYYGFVVATIYLLAGLVAPQLLSTDRRTGMLGVYLASPLNRVTYLAGKAISTLALVSLVTIGPTLLMLIAYTLTNVGPDGFVEWLRTLVMIVASGLVIGVLYSAIGLAMAAFTDRSVVASAMTMAVIPGSAIATDILVYEADLPRFLHLFNILALPRDMILRLQDERPLWSSLEVSTASEWLAWFAWSGLALAFVWWRYRKLLVRR